MVEDNKDIRTKGVKERSEYRERGEENRKRRVTERGVEYI